jgi:hypothetical protein
MEGKKPIFVIMNEKRRNNRRMKRRQAKTVMGEGGGDKGSIRECRCAEPSCG